MSKLNNLFGEHSAILGHRNFQIILVVTLVVPLGSGLVSPVLDSLIEPLGASPTNIGLVVSLFTAPGIVVIPLAGNLADRYGRKPVIVSGLLLFGASGTAISLTSSFALVLGLRVLQGIAFASLNPVLITSLGDLYSSAEETTAQGFRIAVSGISLMVFPFLAGLIVVAGWQYVFYFYALAFPAAVAVYIWFDEPTSFEGKSDSEQSTFQELVVLVKHRRVTAILVARSLPTLVWYGFLSYISIVVVRVLSGSPQQAGVLVAAGSLSFAVASSQAGRITARVNSRYTPLIGASIILAVGLTLIGLSPAVSIAGAGAVATGFGFGIAGTLYRSLITGFAADSVRGSIVGIGETLGRVTATAAPVGMGAAISLATPLVGFSAAVRWTVAGTGLLAGGVGLVCLFVARHSPPVNDARTFQVGD